MKQVVFAALVLFLTYAHEATAQEKKNDLDRALQGGMIVVDLLKLFKPDKTASTGAPMAEHSLGAEKVNELCFRNEQPKTLKITLRHKETGDKKEIVVPPEGQECALEIYAGIYECEVIDQTTNITLRKGDIRLTPDKPQEVKRLDR